MHLGQITCKNHFINVPKGSFFVDKPRVKPIVEDPAGYKTRYMVFSDKIQNAGDSTIILSTIISF
ncbi:hypothetical protein V2J09_008845 [Rumex salicifolius]